MTVNSVNAILIGSMCRHEKHSEFKVCILNPRVFVLVRTLFSSAGSEMEQELLKTDWQF